MQCANAVLNTDLIDARAFGFESTAMLRALVATMFACCALLGAGCRSVALEKGEKGSQPVPTVDIYGLSAKTLEGAPAPLAAVR